MSTPVEKALAEAAQLEKSLAKDQARLRELRSFLRTAATLDESIQYPKPATKQTVVAAAEWELVLEAPLSTVELLKRVKDAGVTFTGKNHAATLSSLMSRSGKFVYDRERGWSNDSTRVTSVDDL